MTWEGYEHLDSWSLKVPKQGQLKEYLKLSKVNDKEKTFWEPQGKKQLVKYKGALRRLSAHLSAETLQARRE